MRSVSQYNLKQSFVYEFRESRLKKAAHMIDSLTPGRMLDVGCSTGDWGVHWKEMGMGPMGSISTPTTRGSPRARSSCQGM
jgi:ubiquinone/menaquinone biosynthesis C-methylase UbiE